MNTKYDPHSDDKNKKHNPDKEQDKLDDEIEQSFPASDPPSSTQPHPEEDKDNKTD